MSSYRYEDCTLNIIFIITIIKLFLTINEFIYNYKLFLHQQEQTLPIIFIQYIAIIIKLQMGNECPECETPETDCKMRDIFKDQPRNRDDLHLQQYKHQSSKVRSSKKQRLEESAVKIDSIPVSQSVFLEKVNNKEKDKILQKKSRKREERELIASAVEEIKQPLSLDNQLQTIQLKKGINYIGKTVQRQPHQKGKVTWQDGTTMIGQFFLGTMAENQQILLQTSNGSTYQGSILEGKANAKGKLVLSDGSSYQGEWKDDLPHGYGKHKMSDGSYFEGNFINGEKSGKGKYYFDDSMYQGMFLHDKFHGEGIMIMKERTIRGQWKNGMLEGNGEIEWKSGEKYCGTFSGNERDGEGTYYFADGRSWTGEWRNDVQNGFGCYQLSSGVTIKGIWVNGVKSDEMRQN